MAQEEQLGTAGAQMGYANTPASVIKGAMDSFVFACFLKDAIQRGRITASTFHELIGKREEYG